MKTLLEANDQNIEHAAATVGTHYLVVEDYKLAGVRAKLYAAGMRAVLPKLHTSYNRKERVLRVVVGD